MQVSIDLETLGTGDNAQILSLGAVRFDQDGLQDTFYAVVDLEDPRSCTGEIDHSTVLWWFKQSDEARLSITYPTPDTPVFPLHMVLVKFSEWLGLQDDGELVDCTVWQRGSKDAAWLETSYKRYGLKMPFGWWCVKDQRTWCDPWRERDGYPEGKTAHHALADAEKQAERIIFVNKLLEKV